MVGVIVRTSFKKNNFPKQTTRKRGYTKNKENIYTKRLIDNFERLKIGQKKGYQIVFDDQSCSTSYMKEWLHAKKKLKKHVESLGHSITVTDKKLEPHKSNFVIIL